MESGRFRRDESQSKVLETLDRLKGTMSTYHDDMVRADAMDRMEKERAEASSSSTIPTSKKKKMMMPRGVYLYGSPGSGKSMCMDALHDSFDSMDSMPRRRVHFHTFMQEMHRRIHEWKQQATSKAHHEADAITEVARQVSSEARLLCFDEFQVTDIADALILGRILRVLFSEGTVMVATSNTPPSELYAGGLNRRDFMSTISVIERHCRVRALDQGTDHRVESHGDGAGKVYFSPGSLVGHQDEFTRAVREALQCELGQYNSENHKTTTDWSSVQIPTIYGRAFHVPRSVGRVCYFTFEELCGSRSDAGSPDFQAICESFHTVVLSDIPYMSAEETPRHNEARRFINLIDQLYDSKVRLICSSADVPLRLFRTPPRQVVELVELVDEDSDHAAEKITGKCFRHEYVDPAAWVGPTEAELPSVTELKSAFGRAASRLIEMSGSKYQSDWRLENGFS